MSIYQKKTIVASYPAYDIVELDTASNGRINLKAGDQFTKSEKGGQSYSISSAASYALENGQCPIEAYNREVERGYEAYWINANATVLTAHAQAKRTLIKVPVGTEINFEGKFFIVESAPNNNLKLTEITE